MKIGKNKKSEIDSQTRRRPTNNLQEKNSRVFSYYSSRSQDNENRGRNEILDQNVKSKNRNLKYLPSFIGLLFIITAIFYATLINVNKPEIIPLSEESINVLASPNQYQDSISKIFNDNILNRSKLTINTKKIEEQIKLKHPEIKEVSVNIPLLGRRPVVQISPADPNIIVSTNNGMFAVDINGKVLGGVNNIPEEKLNGLLKINDKVFTNVKPGDTIIPDSTIKFIDDVKFQFNAKQIEIESIELPNVANELHIKPKNAEYIVKFNLQGDAREQSGVYFSVLDRLSKDSGLPKPKEYIDVRVESRAFYK